MTDRDELILAQLRQNGRLTVPDLAQRCDCSEPTVRRALSSLERQNRIVRTVGGAMPVDQVSIEVAFPERLTINSDQKHRIARRAADDIHDGQVVLLDNGSSVYLLAEYLADKRNLTIITSFLPLVNKLNPRDDWRVILAGGQLRTARGDLVGPLTEQFFSGIRADVAFFGADGLDVATGVWTVDPESAALTRAMCRSAQRRILLADSTKLAHRAAFAAVDWIDVDSWITDSDIDPDLASAISQHDVQLEMV
jgi:DeoR family fructose operon transcriptional repressor